MTLGSHQRSVGRDQERFTPRFIIAALGRFDTDAATASRRPFDIAPRNITPAEDALSMDWAEFGRTWLNCPFDRRVVGAFVERMVAHDHGVMLLHARTETAWFAPVWRRAAGLLFLERRVVFLRADGTPATVDDPDSKHYGKVANSGAPVVLSAFGDADCEVLAFCGLDGHFVPLIIPRSVLARFVGTWRQAIEAAFPAGEPIRLAEAYRKLCEHPVAAKNRHPKEKIRQVLGRGGFTRTGRAEYRRTP